MSVSFDISHPEIQGAVRRALAEDIGGGDVTSQVCVPAKCEAQGTFLAREQQIVAGTELLPLIYEMRGGVEQLCIHKFSGASAEAQLAISKHGGA
jgi:nicotinate-nucleotide pyrophosphorylase